MAKAPNTLEAPHAGPVSASRTGAWHRAGRALRASDWWYFTLLPVIGVIGVAGEIDVPRLGADVLVAAFCLAYAYGFNGITDRGLDRDETKNALAGLADAPHEAALLVAGCALAAVAVGAALSSVALFGAATSLLAATVYSAQPRLKRLPVVGTLVNVLIFIPLPLLALAGPPSRGMLFLTCCFYVLLTQNQILHEVGDGHEDLAAGVRTTGTAVGPAGVRVIAVALGPLAALLLSRTHLEATTTSVAAAVILCAGAVFVALGDAGRAGRLRVAHRWFSLFGGGVLFALVARGGA